MLLYQQALGDPDLKSLLKKTAFTSGDREELKRVHSELKYPTRRCKDSYRRQLERHMEQNNIQDVWRGLREMSGHRPGGDGHQASGDQI